VNADRVSSHHAGHHDGELIELRERSQKDQAELTLLRQEVRDQAAARNAAEEALKRDVKELRTALNVARWDSDQQTERITVLEDEKREVEELLRQCEEDKAEVRKTLVSEDLPYRAS
jgi:hypothetical protein